MKRLYPIADESGTISRDTRRRFFVLTGEHRAPKKGEWYLSGAIAEAYQAPNNLSTRYHIAREVPHTTVTGDDLREARDALVEAAHTRLAEAKSGATSEPRNYRAIARKYEATAARIDCVMRILGNDAALVPLTAADLGYLRDLIETEQGFQEESRHLERDAPKGILERLEAGKGD